MVQQYGPIYHLLLSWFDYQMPSLLSTTSTATNVILLYCIWTGLGGNMIVYLAAMTRLPGEVLESARVDGVNPFQEMMQMVFPLMWSTISTTLILTFTAIFTASGPILLFTRGGADTYTIAYWIYEQVYITGRNFEYASAMGLMYALFGLPIIIVARTVFGKIYADVEY
jgi:ABC-type sugar transport system permease subunit